MWNITRRATIVTAALIVGLAASYTPSQAAEGEARTTVTDQPGAPGMMLQRFEDLTGQSVGDLDKVLAVDAGGRNLTVDQLEALVAGEEVDGVKVVGTMPGGRGILDTTMADLADGVYDGKGDSETATSSLLFATSVPGGREWCLTMCIAAGKSVRECMLSRQRADQIRTLDFASGTTVGGMKAAFEKANGVAVDGPDAVETLIGDGEPSAEEVEAPRRRGHQLAAPGGDAGRTGPRVGVGRRRREVGHTVCEDQGPHLHPQASHPREDPGGLHLAG